MACNDCEKDFLGNPTIQVEVVMSGTDVLLWVTNSGRNPVQICRIFVCWTSGASKSMIALRPPPYQIAWNYPKAIVEPGLTVLFFNLGSFGVGTIIQAQAEYIEFAQRARSCPLTIGGKS
jgi:hypothetical protein